MDKVVSFQDKYNALQQNVRDIFAKVYILNNAGKKIGQIEGNIISGNISVNSDSLIRRTGTITLALNDDNLDVAENKFFWFNNRIELHIGVKYNDDIVWYKLGNFILDETSKFVSSRQKTITIDLLDNMCLFDGTRGGKVDVIYKIENDLPIHEVIEGIVNKRGYMNRIIEQSEHRTPYKIEKNIGDNFGSVIEELRGLYLDYETFIDLDGNFVFRRVRNLKSDPIIYRFLENDMNLVDIGITYSFKNVKNRVKIYGRTNPDTGIAVEAEATNNHPNSPFAIDKIGEVFEGITDSKLHTKEQVQKKAEAELIKASNLAEKVTISCIPIYNLDVNNVVYIKVEKDGLNINGRFQIKKLSIPFDEGDLMRITCVRLYDDEETTIQTDNII